MSKQLLDKIIVTDIVKTKDLDFLSESVYADACRLGHSKETSIEEMKELYKSLL